MSRQRRTALRNAIVSVVAAASLAIGGTWVGTSYAVPHEPVADASHVASRVDFDGRRVLLISVDGLNPRAITRLGRRRAPHLHRLIRNGASTLNARTLRERTQTLPNHAGMLTGRRVKAAAGGHGVWFDTDTGTTVHATAGERVRSVFDVVHDAGGSTTLISTKSKFDIFERSWGESIDRYDVRPDDSAAVTALLARGTQRDTFTMLHLAGPDRAGHQRRFMSAAYLTAVRKTDAEVGRILRHLRKHPQQRAGLQVVLTSDHGGLPGLRGHAQRRRRDNYRVPLVVWGDAVTPGGLYAMNHEFRNPRKRRTSYAGKQPIRNAAVANLSTSLLGLPAVPGSTVDRRQRLDVAG